MDRRPTDDAAPPRSNVQELRVTTDGTDWIGAPSPRRVMTAPNSPSTTFRTDREAIFRSGNATVAETHLIRSTGSQSNSFTEEHWSSEITSFVATAPPKFIQVIKAYRILSSDTPTLVVEVASDPPAIFEWFCNDKSVQQDRRRFQARHGLNITTLTVHQPEQGVYKCTARNPAGVSTSYGYITVNFEHQFDEWTVVDRSMVTEEGQTTVTVHRSPRFINQVPNLTIQPGSEAVIDVEVDADPPARFTWFVNGREYRESTEGVELFYPSANRCVIKFAFPVSGEYKVVASNVHGSAMSSGYVEIHRAKPSKQMRPPVKAGEHISHSLMAASHHAGSTAAPTAPDGQELLQTHRTVNVYEVNYTQRASSVPRGVRHLESHVETPVSPKRRVSLEEHRAGPDESFEMVPVDLPEESAPKIIEPLHSASFIDGQPMLLRCRIKAVPSAAIVWSKDDINVEEWVINKDIVTQIHPDGICELMNPEVYPEDSGLYKCTATNPHGTAETAAYINIQGIDYAKGREEGSASAESAAMMSGEPPKFVEKLTAETDGAYDLNYVRLICRVKCAVRTTITWWKNDVELIPGEKYELHEFSDGALILTIYSPTPSDNGVYTCKAESANGVSTTSCEVTVPTRTAMVTETMSGTQTDTTTLTETVDQSSLEVTETSKGEDYVATTEITKHEEEYKLLVKVAENVASALVANVFVDAVREAVKRIMEEESEEEEIEVTNAPRFETSIERYVVKENDTVTISTVVTGEPTPFIEWYFKDQKLHVSQQISMGYENRIATLILKNVTFAQEGTYYCHATNTHGTTVLPSEVKVVPEKAGDTIRISLARYDKQTGSEQLITNIHASHKDEEQQQTIGIHSSEKENVSGRCRAVPRQTKKIVEKTTELVSAEEVVVVSSPEQAAQKKQFAEQPPVVAEPSGQPSEAAAPPESAPVPPPRKHIPKEREVPVPITSEATRTEEEQKVRLVAVKFADTFTESVMNQAETDLSGALNLEESLVKIIAAPGAKILEEQSMVTKTEETIRKSPSRDSPTTSKIVTKSAEIINAGMATIDVRRPNAQFDHVVTVVEPEVIQLGLRLPSPNVPSMKFIDLETILQRPGTSSSANTLISSPQRGSANAEHRIVVLEGVSQKFHNAMTLSLKKVHKLATESAEPSTFVQIEIIKPNETSEEVLTIVNTEKLIPDLLRVAAAASKLKMENVTVSLVKQGNTAHQELVIEYESHVEDAAAFNISHLVYEGHPYEVSSRQETWSRRSRFSDKDENVVAVFMEVDASCPDQSVEIVASVSSPTQEKVGRPPTSPSPDKMEASESLTESSSAMGQQIPRFVKTLQDCHTVIGRSAQLKCIVSGMPPPEVAWYVDGDVIQSSREYEMVYEDGVCLLRINEALVEDEGEYSCEAKNSAGKAVTKCYLKVLKDEPPPTPAPRFIQHVPSLVELVDDGPDSFDSFEFEENKANKLFASDAESYRSSVTYNSEFDLSRIVSYNEDMEETNAFHRYFDTAETGVRIMEWEQRERLYASFLSKPAAKAHVDFVIRKPASYSSAAHLFAIPSLHVTHADVFKPHAESEHGQDMEMGRLDLEKEAEEPREPDLPTKMSYKGQEIAVSVKEIEKEQVIMNESGEMEISRKTCRETSFEFDTELDITQSIRIIRNALPDEEDAVDYTAEIRSPLGTEYHEIPIDTCLGVEYETWGANAPVRNDLNSLERTRAQSAKPKPRLFGQTGKSASEGAAKLESAMFDPEFISKMKEIERIARQVDEELGHLSSSPRRTASPPKDVKEIEEAIYKISDQLVLARPVTEAQAEASDELLRTTLADMILNPTRTAAEELELLRRPIRILRRKLSDLESSLLEDAEVTDINDYTTETAIPAGETPPVLRSEKDTRNRVPSADYLRVTPLTSNIKEQLSSLEAMISIHVNGETSDSADGEEIHAVVKGDGEKKRELHNLFVQINNEINTIKTYCRTQLSKRGTDAVMNVLHKVRTHVTSIVNVMSLSKKKRPKAISKHGATVAIEYDLIRPSAEEQTEAMVMGKSSSLEQSDYRKSSTAASTSDDTWKFSTELKSSWKGVSRSEINEEDEPALLATVECTTEEEVSAPIAPPRRRRTRSAELEPSDPPSRPPRKPKDSLTKRDRSLDNILITGPTNIEKRADPPLLSPKETSPGKTIKSFAGDTMEMLRNFSCMRAQKDPVEDLEKSLLEELSQMAVSHHEEELLSEPEWVQSELIQSLKRGAERARVEQNVDDEQEQEPVSVYETSKITATESKGDLKENAQDPPLESENTTEMSYAGTSLSAAYLLLSEATAALEIPLTNVMTTSGDIWAEDGVSSVQMTCEESDYATDTDTSGLLKGTVQFFNRYSPRGATPQSISSISASQRNSIMPDLSEQDETAEITVNVDLNKEDTQKTEDVELLYTEVSMMTRSDEKGKVGRFATVGGGDSVSPEKESFSDDTVHIVLEEAQLSQMASSEWTDDTDRMSSRMGVRETDILSDDSVITEIDRSIVDNVVETFSFMRAQEKKALVAQLYPDVRMFASARIAENTFDVEIHQEPESLGLVIRVIEDQVNFTSLTVMEFTPQLLDAQRTYDDQDDASSFEDIEGEGRTGITVSIIARSLHDGIYASLEEIPWGEVEMTLPECESIGRGLGESKTSLQFNVTVSESNPDERKSLRSQVSLEQSQNTVSEMDNTLSNGSINIPSYIIKLGSTATITCELNNYLPPNSKIDWYKGTTQVTTCPGKLDRISHDLLEVLIINNIEMEDNELYSLKVNDDIFPVAYLIVESPSSEDFTATILTPPQTQFVMEGQPTVLMCQVSNPNQEVTWLKDRKPLKETSRLQLVNSDDGWSRVVFSQTRMSDQGTYYAVLGEQSVAITLVVEERIDEKEVTVVASGTESEDEDVQEYLMPPGSTATIACELEDGDHVPSLVWLKNGREIAFTNPNKMEHVINGLKHYLVIHDTSPKDTGLYSVSISNTEFRVAHLAINDLATVSQNLRRKRISNSSLH